MTVATQLRSPCPNYQWHGKARQVLKSSVSLWTGLDSGTLLPVKHLLRIKPNLSQILMDLHEIFSIGPQWANRYEVTLNLTHPHLPSFVMTYHDLPTQLKQMHIYQPKINLCYILATY